MKNRGPSGSNERIGVAVIGLGPLAGVEAVAVLRDRGEASQVRLAAVCDLHPGRLAAGQRRGQLKASDTSRDYRRVLERPDVDAVVVATPDITHARICLDALDAGKHVYCERPFTRYLAEAFAVADKIRQSGRCFQLGAQACSGGAWAQCAELVRAGTLGRLVWSRAGVCHWGGPSCDGCSPLEPETTAADIDWTEWLGPLGPRPFSSLHFHQWRLYSEYSAGLLGCAAPRWLYPLLLSTGRVEFPRRVGCQSSLPFLPGMPLASSEPGQVPAHTEFLAEFPSGHTLSMTCSWLSSRGWQAPTLYGHRATLSAGSSGERVELTPEPEFASQVEPRAFSGLPAEDWSHHLEDWLGCIRTGRTPSASGELALAGQVVLSLAEMSDRLSTVCCFEPSTRKVTDGSGRELTPLTYGSAREWRIA